MSLCVFVFARVMSVLIISLYEGPALFVAAKGRIWVPTQRQPPGQKMEILKQSYSLQRTASTLSSATAQDHVTLAAVRFTDIIKTGTTDRKQIAKEGI